MHNLSINLDQIEFPATSAFTSTRDVVRSIVRRIADVFATENVTIALEATADRETPSDSLIVFDGSHTATMPLKYTAQTVWIGSVAYFIAHPEGVPFISDQIVSAIRNVVRRWRE
jgi:hypothetical protein